MSDTVNAAVVCNSLSQVDSPRSGAILFAIEASATGIGYTEYKEQDKKLGATREINHVYSVGKRYNSKFYTTGTEISNSSNFMPVTPIKTDDYPNGVVKNYKDNPTRVASEKTLKAMGLNLKSLTNTMIGTSHVPAIGSAEWLPYRRAHIASGGSMATEGTLHQQMIMGQFKKDEGQKDVANISVGYFGRIDPKQTIAPVALYYTLLELIGNGKSNAFSIKNKELDIKYTMSGFVHRKKAGTMSLSHNKHPKVGTGKVKYYNNNSNPYQADNNTVGPSGHYVSIQVQTSYNEYAELVLFDFAQLTTVTKDGETKVVNSANPSQAEKDQEDFDMEKYYSERTFVPLTKSAMKKVSVFKRANLLLESKASVIQVLNVQETPWYASGWFKIIVFAITTIVNMFVPGVGFSLKLVINMAIQLTVAYAVTFLIEALVKAGIITNGWVAAALGIALMAVTGYYGFSSFNLDFKSINTINLLMEATGKAVRYESIIESNDYKSKMKELNEEQKKLDTKENDYENLHTPSGVARLQGELSRMLDRIEEPIMESVEQFINRTTKVTVMTEPLNYSGLQYELKLEGL